MASGSIHLRSTRSQCPMMGHARPTNRRRPSDQSGRLLGRMESGGTMNIATAALVFGVVFVLAGISGFFAAPPPANAPALTVEHGHGLALGIFPVNTLHNAVHLLFGVLGLAAARGAIMSA